MRKYILLLSVLCLACYGCMRLTAYAKLIELEFEPLPQSTCFSIKTILPGMPIPSCQNHEWGGVNRIIITDAEIERAINVPGCYASFSGTRYAVIKERTILNSYKPYQTWLFDHGIASGNTFDGDNWARNWSAYMQFCYSKSSAHYYNAAEGIAAGVVYLKPKPNNKDGSGEALILFFTVTEDRNIIPKLYSPYYGMIIDWSHVYPESMWEAQF